MAHQQQFTGNASTASHSVVMVHREIALCESLFLKRNIGPFLDRYCINTSDSIKWAKAGNLSRVVEVPPSHALRWRTWAARTL